MGFIGSILKDTLILLDIIKDSNTGDGEGTRREKGGVVLVIAKHLLYGWS